MKRGYIIAVLTRDNKIGFYTGNSIDSLKRKAKKYTLANATVKIVNTLKKNDSLKHVQIFYSDSNISHIKKVLIPSKNKRVVNKSRIGKNIYIIKPTNDKQFPFVITCNETVVSAHRNRKEANAVKQIYIKGDLFTSNPIQGSRKRRIVKAKKLYAEFTGHNAVEYENVKLPDDDVGLKVGRCVGIMYETIRDGKKESYLHEFKKASQPDFCVSADGQQIYLIGGNYLFKDSGINDI